jgi:hypothetical protein
MAGKDWAAIGALRGAEPSPSLSLADKIAERRVDEEAFQMVCHSQLLFTYLQPKEHKSDR